MNKLNATLNQKRPYDEETKSNIVTNNKNYGSSLLNVSRTNHEQIKNYKKCLSNRVSKFVSVDNLTKWSSDYTFGFYQDHLHDHENITNNNAHKHIDEIQLISEDSTSSDETTSSSSGDSSSEEQAQEASPNNDFKLLELKNLKHSPNVDHTPKLRKNSEQKKMKENAGNRDKNVNNIISCLRNFSVNTSNKPDAILIDVLKHYSLGEQDTLKCCLCCIYEFDLTGFKTNMTNNCNKPEATRIRCCNQENLKIVRLYVNSFNPFCPEYSKRFYPDCNGKKQTSTKQEKFIRTTVPCGKNRHQNCKTPVKINNISNNNATLSRTHTTNETKSVNNVKSIIDCLKEFNIKIANDKINQKYKFIDNCCNNNTSNDSLKMRNQATINSLKFKEIPICRDENGNLVANINIPEQLSLKVHGISSSLLSKTNSNLTTN